ncbi:LOW QUALITY PROTEIN: hypothetical protein ACHAXN_004079 [Cyclotella atomus]
MAVYHPLHYVLCSTRRPSLTSSEARFVVSLLSSSPVIYLQEHDALTQETHPTVSLCLPSYQALQHQPDPLNNHPCSLGLRASPMTPQRRLHLCAQAFGLCWIEGYKA